MKVYLATSGEYSDYGVCHAFARREDAESYALGDDVLELEVHEGPIEVRDRWRLIWHPQGQHGAEPSVYDERADYDGMPDAVRHEWCKGMAWVPYLMVTGWDRERVLKVYSEQRAQHIARKDMGVEK